MSEFSDPYSPHVPERVELPSISDQITNTRWGLIEGPKDADVSIAVVFGQHGDEYAGQQAGLGMMELMRVSPEDESRAISMGGRLLEHLKGMENVRMLFAPGLNSTGLQRGSRRYNCPFDYHTGHGASSVDLNRQWKPGSQHPVTQPVWQAIQELPGRVYVVDVHSQARESFAYVSQRSRVLLEQALPNLTLKTPALEPEEFSTTLQGAAEAAGHWAVTLELSNKEQNPQLFGAEFIRALIQNIFK